MKKITAISSLILTGLVTACGGGDPESSSSKPDSLFPDDFVAPSSSSASSASSSAGSGIVNQAIPFHENFDNATNTRTFFTVGYKALNTFSELPFYYPTGGFLDENGNPSPTATSWITGDANRKLRIGNGRLTFGQTKLEAGTTTADPNTPTWGEFDLSKSYKLSFCVVEVSPASSSNFEVYVDNNTTGGNNSIYGAGNASRILQVATHTLVPGTRHEVTVPTVGSDRLIGSATSFLQFRVSSGGWAVIDDVVVEYAGEPHGFTLPTCTAETSIAPEPEVAPTTPAAPTLIAGDAEIVASWASAGVGATYEVRYNTQNNLESATAFTGNPVSTTSVQLTELVNGQEYFVWVRATNAVGSSDFSEPASATPVAPSGTDESKAWGFNSFNYTELLAGTSGTVAVTVSETPYDVDGLKIFLNNGSALRYRFDSNAWNFNGNSWTTSSSTVPAVGEVVDPLRAYIGVPVVEGRAVELTFRVKQTGSGQSGKAVLVDQDNRVINSIVIADNTVEVDLPLVLAEGHEYTEIRVFYSRENTASGGMDLTRLVKNYADSPLPEESSSSSAASSEASSSSVASSVASSEASSAASSSEASSSAASSEASSVASSSEASSEASSSAASSEASSAVSSSEASSEASSESSSSASSDVGGSSSDSSSSAASSVAALLTEDFSAADSATFFSTAYKTIPGDNTLPLYVATAGGTRITFANGELSMNNARFTIGDKGGATAAGVQPNGSFDLLNKPYRVKFTILAATGTGNIQVYVDNNTTSAGSSIHNSIGSTASRLIQIGVSSLTSFPHEVVIESDVGTATSFFQIRADSSVTNLTIDNLTIEYQ